LAGLGQPNQLLVKINPILAEARTLSTLILYYLHHAQGPHIPIYYYHFSC